MPQADVRVALVDDGKYRPGITVHTLTVRGCTQPAALNYNPRANANGTGLDAKSARAYACVPRKHGCVNRSASNFNRSANVDTVPSSCVMRRYGCTERAAYNFDSRANTKSIGGPSSTTRILG